MRPTKGVAQRIQVYMIAHMYHMWRAQSIITAEHAFTSPGVQLLGLLLKAVDFSTVSPI